MRVCGFSVFWQGCSRGFEQCAARLRNDLRLQTQMRPARETTRQTAFCKEKQRGQGAEKPRNRVCSGVTQ